MLRRKLVRELRHHWAQVLSIAAVVAAGVMTVIVMRSTYDSLVASQSAYYDEYRFAHVFASARRAPESVARALETIPGVAAVQTRVVKDVALDVPGLDQAAVGRLVSVPSVRQPMLNDLFLRRGRYIEAGRLGEALISERFARVNGLDVGDTVAAVINGRWQPLRIVGIALSPEYIYEIGGAAGLFGDDRLFGVLWVEREALAAAFDMTGAFNDVALTLAPGASEARVIDALDRLLAPYGGTGAYGRADQLSHSLIRDELEQNRITGTALPVIFLGVAAFLLHIVMSRLIATQRDQIAVLKAFGYDDLTVAVHYLGFALAAVAVGAAVGIGAGIWLGGAMTELYGSYFGFPLLLHRVRPELAGGAVVVAGGAGVLGALSAVRAALRLPPAEAMRPEPPASFRPIWLERMGLGHLASPALRMVLRNLERRPARAAAAVVGIAMSTALLTVGRYFVDAVTVMVDLQFRTVQREDVTVGFATTRPAAVRHELAGLPGVSSVELYRTVPVRLRNGYRERTVALTGIEPEARLRRLVDRSGRVFSPPAGGVVLTTVLARALDVRAGETLELELLERGGAPRRVLVAGTVDELLGANAYMSWSALHELIREAPAASGAYLELVDRDSELALLDRLKRTPAVAGASSRISMIGRFEELLGQQLYITTGIVSLLASLLAIGVVYNGARIALSERGRELASLRVLGFTRGEVAVMLLGEQAVVTLLAIPLGCVVGYLLVGALVASFQTELYRLPLVISGRSYLFAAGITLAAALFAALATRRRLNRLDLIAVLKTRE